MIVIYLQRMLKRNKLLTRKVNKLRRSIWISSMAKQTVKNEENNVILKKCGTRNITFN